MIKAQKLILLTICFIFLIVSNNFAEPQKKHTWSVDAETFYAIKRQGESTRPDGGMMYGLATSYTYCGKLPLFPFKINRWLLKMEGRGSWGEIDYGDGYHTDERLLEFRSLVGYIFSTSKAITITPYTGTGYRYLNSDWPGGSIDKYKYFYVPVGIKGAVVLDKDWSIGAKLEYDCLLWGELEHKSNYLSFEAKQDKGYGLRCSMEFLKKVKKIDFAVEPFIKYWKIRKSEHVTMGVSLGNAANGASGLGWYNLTNMVTTIPINKHSSEEIGIKFSVKF